MSCNGKSDSTMWPNNEYDKMICQLYDMLHNLHIIDWQLHMELICRHF